MKQDLLSESKLSRLIPRLLYYGSIYIAIISVIVSITGFVYSILPPQEPILSNPWNSPMSISVDNLLNLDDQSIGRIVSYSNEGDLTLGAGFTIYKNIHQSQKNGKYIKTTSIGDNIGVMAYLGHLDLFTINHSTIGNITVVDLHKDIIPQDIITIHENIVLILTNTSIIPVFVKHDNNVMSAYVGVEAPYINTPKENPIIDNLDNDCFVINYHNQVDNMTVTVGCITISETVVSVDYKAMAMYASNKLFSGVSGLSSNKFIVGFAGDKNEATSEMNSISFMLGTYENEKITFKSEHIYGDHKSFGFFDMDNLNDYISIVTFIDEKTDNGLVSVLIEYDKNKDDIKFGTYFDIQDGGASGRTASGQYQFIYLRILSATRFGVYYSNMMNNGAHCFAMCEVTPEKNIVALGPEYIINKSNENDKTEEYYFAECRIDDEKFLLVDTVFSPTHSILSASVGFLKSNPLGIIELVDNESNKLKVSTAGVYTFPDSFKTLTPGRYYYSTENGNIIEGEFIGTGAIEGISVYIENENTLLSLDNRIGYAISKNQIFIEREY